jgi:aspartate/methionine/tyrosine aminotransferase
MCALPRVSANFQKDARSIVAHRKDELCSALADAGIPFKEPEGGFYVWLKVEKSNQSVEFNATEWCVEIARKSGVGLWPGIDFGGAGHVRIAITAPSAANWQTAVRNLKDVLAKHG